MKLYTFRTVLLSIIRSFLLYVQQWYMLYRFAESLQAVSKPVWQISLLCVQWKTPDDGQKNCPKRVEFNSKNKFEKSVDLVSFIIWIYHDAHHLNVKRFRDTNRKQVYNLPIPKFYLTTCLCICAYTYIRKALLIY